MGKARKLSSAGIYHIVSKGVGGQIIFEDDDDRRHFLVLLKKFSTRDNIRIAGWVLMDNHFHLIAFGSLEAIARMMRSLKGTYSQDANKRYGRKGHLFQSIYGSFPIEDESYLAAAVLYLHNNPVRAGIVRNAFDYPWSSAREYAGESYIVEPALMLDIDLTDVVQPNHALMYSSHKSSDERVAAEACGLLGIKSPTEIRQMDRSQRDESLRRLSAELSIRNSQISRITGISESTIGRVIRSS